MPQQHNSKHLTLSKKNLGEKAMSARFRKLFEPINVGKKVIKNRICLPSMCMNFAGPNGEVTELDVAYFVARTRGGAGLITIDYACVSPEGRGMPGQRGIWDDKFIPGLARLADIVKASGATTNVQIHHAGVNSITGEVVGPSRLSNQYYFISKPRELSTEEVEQLVQKFADAAFRAEMAGIDMVEVHGTHGYLVCQFLSPLTNKRTDKYGRDRALFALEIVEAIKKRYNA
jgi:2,4-dienoyl-CoA reductase-like NADH-dependent reductase (Old Yellow Enzyme family)